MNAKPFLFRLARRDDADRWSVGWDCGAIVFRRDFVVYDGSVLETIASKEMVIASKAMHHHFSLPAGERASIEAKLNEMGAL